jgi:hypothetical protein
LQKLVDAQAAQRGELGTINNNGSTDSNNETGAISSLLENLSVSEQSEQEKAAKEKLAASRQVAPAQATAKTAAELHGAKGRLVTPPSSGNVPKVKAVLRKPAGVLLNNQINKKATASSMGGKARVNKLNMEDSAFEVDKPTPEPAEEAPKHVAPAVVTTAPVLSPVVEKPKMPLQHQGSSMEQGVAKLKEMNNDFFAGM